MIGHERPLAEVSAVVRRLWIGDHLARILACAKVSADELVQTKLLRASHLDDALERCSEGDTRDHSRDIFGCHGLKQYRCEPHRVADRRGVGDSLHELEELSGKYDRVRDR